MLASDSPSKTFFGVHFYLYGFDPVNQHKVRVKLIEGGGVGVDHYSQNCTHVIVDKTVYDDPVCVAARADGKTVVTGLWVDRSFDIGMPVDATTIMYKPLSDLNGIPGAKSLTICLTGYQRQDRDDVMTMVSLMGAQFSKPLVASKVTHLICYKFEGAKYELAKKVKKIKIINHRWLEDCLREWELLSEANYSKSGYELEATEAEAEAEAEDSEKIASKQSGQKCRNPHNLKSGMLGSSELLNPAVELTTSTMPGSPPNTMEVLLLPHKPHQGTSFNNVNVPELHAFQDSGLRNASSIKLAEPRNRSTNCTNVDNSLTSTSKSPSISDDKFTAISYSRKTPRRSPGKSTTPNLSGDILGNIFVSPQDMGIRYASDLSSFKMQLPEKRISSCFTESPWKGSDLCHQKDSTGIFPKKRELEFSARSFESQRTSHNAKAVIRGSALVAKQFESTSLVGDELQINDCSVNGTGNLNVVRNSYSSNATTESVLNDPSSFNTETAEDRLNSIHEKSPKMSFTGYQELTLSGKLDMQNENVYKKLPQMSFKGLAESTSGSRLIRDCGLERCVQVGGKPGELQNKQQDVEVPSLNDRKLLIENSHSPATLDLLEGGSDMLVTNPLSKKMLAKKTLGSRTKLSDIANRKGSIYSSNIASKNDSAICLNGAEEKATHNNASALETSPPTINTEAAKHVVEKFVSKSQNASASKTQFVADETEAPDEENENDSEQKSGKEKSELVESTCILLEVEHSRHDSKVNVSETVLTSGNGTNRTDPERAVGGKNSELGESTLKYDGSKRKARKRKKQLSGKAKRKTVASRCKNDLAGQDTNAGKNVEEDFLPHPVVKMKSSNASSKVNSVAADKNSPVGCKEIAGKSIVNPTKKAVKTNDKSLVGPNTLLVQKVFNRLKTKPVWFILSGHRLQRKEFQQVISRLKGKFFRDSHQWSYQATHFISPDPIRRTEKFFAAAASGRWILKIDYLSACNRAGKFLAEEPYEWHKKALSEDGAINLEGPRKWRQLRERTGHGAFYGMRIIVYGECVAPPLDTLKRVVKAGDGTILATSPPYTSLLKSGVDYAVVSPGMPRTDLWVQEFLKHEMPCVVADYLVEYVCKPGYSLERHVLYNTHEWAEKSLAKLTGRAEEIVEDLATPLAPDDCGSNDVACQVCGSSERGEFMLICGDESGSVGCGVGTHTDCCDPVLEDVPEEDWFCPKCSKRSRNSTIPSKKRKTGTFQSKDK